MLFSLKSILKKDSKALAGNSSIFYMSTLPENEGQLYKYRESPQANPESMPDPAEYLWLIKEPKDSSISLQQTTSLIAKAKETPITITKLKMSKDTKEKILRPGSPFNILRKSRSPMRKINKEELSTKPDRNQNLTINSKQKKNSITKHAQVQAEGDMKSTRATRYSINLIKEKLIKSKRCSPIKENIVTSPKGVGVVKGVFGKADENILRKKTVNLLSDHPFGANGTNGTNGVNGINSNSGSGSKAGRFA